MTSRLARASLALMLAVPTLCLVDATSIATAQAVSGSIEDRATDPAGAAIPNATVTLRNTDLATVRIVQTDRAGNFRLSGAISGSYIIEAKTDKLALRTCVADSCCKAIQLFEPYTEAWFKLGVTYRPLGQREYARKCWLRVLELDPRHGLTLMNLGNLEFVDGHRERAFELWDRAMKTDHNLAQAAMNMASILADIGDLKEAANLFSKAILAGHPLAQQALDLCRLYDEMDPAIGPVTYEETVLVCLKCGAEVSPAECCFNCGSRLKVAASFTRNSDLITTDGQLVERSSNLDRLILNYERWNRIAGSIVCVGFGSLFAGLLFGITGFVTVAPVLFISGCICIVGGFPVACFAGLAWFRMKKGENIEARRLQLMKSTKRVRSMSHGPSAKRLLLFIVRR